MLTETMCAAEALPPDLTRKRLLAEKPVLARLMKSCVPEYKDCGEDDIAEQYILGTPEVWDDLAGPVGPGPLPAGGIPYYDIRFTAAVPGTGKKIPFIVNIDGKDTDIPDDSAIRRDIFFDSLLFQEACDRERADGNFGELRKVCSIRVSVNPPQGGGEAIRTFGVTERQIWGNYSAPVESYDLLTHIVICLGGEDTGEYGGVLKMLELVLSLDREDAEKRRILREEFGIPRV